MNELAGFLDELAGEGVKDSEGHFTVDLTRWVDKLLKYSTRSKADFLLHLVTAGVALGARSLRYDLRASRSWSLELDCPSLSLEECRNLFPSLVLPGPGARGVALRELAMTLTNLRALGDVVVSLRTGPTVLELWPHYLHLLRSRDLVTGIAIEVRSLSLLRRLTTPGIHPMKWWPRKLPPLHFDYVERKTRLSPMPIYPNPLRAPHVQEWSGAGLVYLRGSDPIPRLPLQPPLLVDETHHESFSAAVLFYPSHSGASLTVLNWGLAYELKVKWRFPVRVLLSHNGLHRDLLGDQIVRDRDYQIALQIVRDFLLSTVAKLAQDPEWAARLEGPLRQAWVGGKLRGKLNHIRFVKLGGWSEVLTPDELAALHRRQGFLHFDRTMVEASLLSYLSKRFTNLVWVTPYRPLESVDNEADWLLRIPFDEGELRYSSTLSQDREWLEKQLPPGMYATFPLKDEDVNVASRLIGQVFVALLKSDPARFWGSLAALQLALWLRPTVPDIAGIYQIREGVPLSVAVEDAHFLTDVERRLIWEGALDPKREGPRDTIGGGVSE